MEIFLASVKSLIFYTLTDLFEGKKFLTILSNFITIFGPQTLISA
jgi:hypothetical protein